MSERLDIDIPVCSECGRLCFSGPPCPEHPMTKMKLVKYRRVEDCEAALAAAEEQLEQQKQATELAGGEAAKESYKEWLNTPEGQAWLKKVNKWELRVKELEVAIRHHERGRRTALRAWSGFDVDLWAALDRQEDSSGLR